FFLFSLFLPFLPSPTMQMPTGVLKNGEKGMQLVLFHICYENTMLSYFIPVGLCKHPLAIRYNQETGKYSI
ncbi:hypothetical protein ACQP3J_30560, partial [Escherichia coli]